MADTIRAKQTFEDTHEVSSRNPDTGKMLRVFDTVRMSGGEIREVSAKKAEGKLWDPDGSRVANLVRLGYAEAVEG